VNIKSNQLNKLLREIGLFNSSNAFYSKHACDKTPKNILLRASKNTVSKRDKESALQHYQHMRAVFNIEPELHEFI